MAELAIAYETNEQIVKAQALAERLHLPIDQQATNQLRYTSQGLQLIIPPFLPMQANFSASFWQKRRQDGKKQGLIRACKPISGLRIIDATAGWGRDAAILACFGAQVHMLERNPIMAALLEDALQRHDDAHPQLNLKLTHTDASTYLNGLAYEDYPDIIYLDPMHPQRRKSALVKKDLQVLQQLIGPDLDALALLNTARQRVLQRVVVKWPQNLPPLAKPDASIAGKTVRFDLYSHSN